MDIINILKKINLQGKFGTYMVIGAGNLLSAIGRGAFVNSSTELYSQLKDRSKDVDKDRILIKAGIGGLIGYGASHMGKIGGKIPGNYKASFENLTNIIFGVAQAQFDNINNKK